VAAIRTDQIRQRIATAVDALTGFSESRFAGPLFARDTDHKAHKSFAIEVATSTPLQDRQRRGLGALTRTDYVVRWCYRLRPDAHVSDYDGALLTEQTVVAAVMGIALTDIQLRWDGEPQRALSPAGDWYLGALTFHVDHLYSLT
jgi:hypothetical protein